MSCSTAHRWCGSTAPAAAPPSVELARLDWAWLRFAPLSFSSLAGIGIVAGALFNILNEAGANPGRLAGDAVERLARTGWPPPSG